MLCVSRCKGTGVEVMFTHVSFYTRFVHDFVEVICCDARLDFSRCDVQDFSCVAADFAHGILLFLIEDSDFVLADEDLQSVDQPCARLLTEHALSYLLALRDSIMRIIRMSDSLRYRSSRTKRIHRPQWACKRICRERIIVPICIWLRNDFWCKDGGEHTVCGLM